MSAPPGDTASPALRRPRLRDYLALVKPRVILLVALVTAAGCFLGAPGELDLLVIAFSLAGTACLCAGASALNQLIERRHDALMERTRDRPLATGRLRPRDGLLVGVVSGAVGIGLLAVGTGWLATALGAMTYLSYVLVYTPLKRSTPLSLIVGAVPGALPPMIGWAAVRGSLPPESWLVFAILFAWQIPHFFAIAWLHRGDYRRAGFRTVAVADESGAAAAAGVFVSSLLLVAISLLPATFGVVGWLYGAGAALLGLAFFVPAFDFALARDRGGARRVLHVSLVYLPVLFLLMVVDTL